MCVFIYIDRYIHEYIYIYTYIHMHIYIYACMCVCACGTHTHVHTCWGRKKRRTCAEPAPLAVLCTDTYREHIL
jgi:hypothetical protein